MAEPEPVKAAASGANNVAKFMKAKTFGMPRWVFVALIVGAVGVGIYMRMQTPLEEGEEGIEGETDLGEAGAFDPDLEGGAMVLGPGPGSVVPVSSPVVPEGLEGILGGISDIFAVISQNPEAFKPPTDGGGDPSTGGGPPRNPRRVVGSITKEEKQRLRQQQEDGFSTKQRRVFHAVVKPRGGQARGAITRAEKQRLLKAGFSRKQINQMLKT